VKIFNKKCNLENNCKIAEIEGNLVKELKKKILQTAAQYKKEDLDKTKEKNKDYKYPKGLN